MQKRCSHPLRPMRSLGALSLYLFSSACVISQALAQTTTVLPEVPVYAASDDDRPSEDTGAYTVRKTKSALGLNLSPKETPQGVSVVTRQMMDDFKLRSANDVLDATPGVVVEKVETDRTYYTARGFDITTFQLDGIGQPFLFGLGDGDPDTFIYDRVETVRGANGLLTNTGNPAATVNFIRKRPTADFQTSGSVSYGSWNDKRLELDVSGSLNDAKTLRGRFVAAVEDKDSYINLYRNTKNTYYGVLEADLGERTTLTLGHTLQESRPKSPLWGGMPLYYSNGTQTSYPVSTSTSVNWAYWNTDTNTTFAELKHLFDNGWEVNAVLTHKDISQDSKLFYVYGQPDASTGLGQTSFPSAYTMASRQDSADVRANGTFNLGGRGHDLMFGASTSTTHTHEQSMNAANISLGTLGSWAYNYAEPAFTNDGGSSSIADRQTSTYVATRLNLADAWKLILGANYTQIRTTGTSYGASSARSAAQTTPYVGAIYDINPMLSTYASYSGIFNPQSQLDTNLHALDPATGDSTEVGFKLESLDKRWNASTAVFKSKQDNLATAVGYVGAIQVYRGQDVTSQGFEFEAAGQITDRLQMNGGYTHISIDDSQGQAARTYTPRHLLKLNASYQVPGIENLKVGGGMTWRSETSNYGTSITTAQVRQPAYALFNLMARYDISKNVYLTANVYNVTDKKYITSLYWPDQGYYGAPRNALVSLNWKY